MMTESRLELIRKDFPMIRITMAGRFRGINDWKKCGLPITAAELEAIPEIPWRDEVFTSPCPFFSDKAVSKTHCLFLSRQESAQSLNTLLPNFFTRSDQEAWHLDRREEFALNPSSLSWHLALCSVPQVFAGKSYSEQLKLLPAGYQPMSAADEIMRQILFRSAADEVNEKFGYFNNTSDVTSDELVVKVCMTEKGVSIGRYPTYSTPTTLLAIERRP